MASIEEHEKNMTVFYSKQTGDIKSIAGGIQTMDFFADNKVDYEIIYGFIVVEKDNYVMENMNNFRVINRDIKLKEKIDVSKYL